MKTNVNSLAIKLNDTILTELIKASSESADDESPCLSPEEYAAEIIETYMASRRLAAADTFISSVMPAVDAALSGYSFATGPRAAEGTI